MTYKVCYWDDADKVQKERDATPGEVAEIEARKAAAASPSAVREKILAEIDRLEGAPNYLNRGARELQLRLMEKEAAELAAARGITQAQVLAGTPYYGKLKALDDQITALRVQL